MSLNYNNSQSENTLVYADPTADDNFNAWSPRHLLDVSAMETEAAIVGGLAAHASNQVALGLEDGGAAGTGTTDIATEIGGDTVVWTDNTPKTMVMSTSASDVDADDWVNVVYNESGTVAPAGFSIHSSYVLGVPAGIA